MKEQQLNIKPKELLGITFNQGSASIPIDLNHNDKNSLFAGSIFSGAVLTAYFATQTLFTDRGVIGSLVATDTRIRFLRPIYTNGVTKLTSHSQPEQKTNGNYQVECEVEIYDESKQKCAILTGTFVLMVVK